MPDDEMPVTKRWRDERKVRFRATPEQAWRAWADPEIIRQWFADEAEGRAEPGDTIVHRFPHFGFQHVYEVLEAEPPHRLVLRADLGGGELVQEILIAGKGGETLLRLVQSGLAPTDQDPSDEEDLEGVDSGWKLALAILRYYLENHFGRERQSLFVMRQAAFSYDDLEELFRSEEGLSRWLTRSGSIGAPGEPVALILHNGERLRGRTLEWTGREAAVSWNDVAGTLELKAFGSSVDRRLLALRLMSWSDDPLPVNESFLRGSLDRLASVLTAAG